MEHSNSLSVSFVSLCPTQLTSVIASLFGLCCIKLSGSFSKGQNKVTLNWLIHTGFLFNSQVFLLYGYFYFRIQDETEEAENGGDQSPV